MMIYLIRHGKDDDTVRDGWSSDFDERYPGGESPRMFYTRVKTAWSELKNKIAEQTGKDTLLVTHGGVIEAILCMENGIAFTNKAKRFSVPSAKLIPLEIPAL